LQKPPAFQFYAKDWRSSPTIAQMTLSERGMFITMLAAAWDSDEPGTLPLPLSALCKVAQLRLRDVRHFLAKYPQLWRNDGARLVNDKLSENWANYLELRDKRKKAAEVRHANAPHMQQSAPAPASASTPETLNLKPTGELFGFEVFWEAYPKQIGKPAAKRAWLRSVKADILWPEVVDGLERWKLSEQWLDQQYIPHPEKFLNERRWQDKPLEGTKRERQIEQSFRESVELAREYGIGEDDLQMGDTPRRALQPARTLLTRRKENLH
jgi:uncharacterized protein YdaU (DUF1376 family)